MSFVRGHFRRTRSGFSYVRPSYRRSHGSGAGAVVFLVAFAVVVSVVMAIVRFVIAHWLGIVVVLATGGAIAIGIAMTGLLRSMRLESYLSLARALVEGRNDRFEELSRLGRRIPTDDQRRTVGEEDLYRSLVAQILADGRVSDEECLRLQRVNATFAFDPQQALAIRESAFDGFMAWVGVDLSKEQEAAVRTVAARLDLPPHHTDRQMAIVSERRTQRERHAAWVAQEEVRQQALAIERKRLDALEAEREAQARLRSKAEREARLAAAREAEAELEAERQRAEQARWMQVEAQRVAATAVFDLPQRTPVEVRLNLKRGEMCWFSGPAIYQDRKTARAGELLVTNKRVLFVSDTTVSVNLSKILDVAADPDVDLLRLVKDGRKTPYPFTLEQPLVALAHLERSLAESSGPVGPHQARLAM